jgi:hypothetical protein
VLTLDGAQAIHPEEDHFRLALPGSFRLAGAVALRARETPLRLGAPDSSQYRIDAELPEGYRVEHPPADFTVEHPCFRLARSSKIEARKIALTIDYRRSCSEIAPADYPGFREAVLRAAHRFGDELTFGEAPRAPEKKRR